MTIQCNICSGTEFQLQDGLRYCTICLTQSQQHGLETVLDEIPIRSQERTRVKTIKSKRRKKVDCCRAFTTLDAFSIILRGWSEEAKLLGLTGPSFTPLLHQFFASYLQKTGRGFLYKNAKPHLGIQPSYRDVQIALTGRNKLCSAVRLHKLKRRRTTPENRKEDVKNLDDDSDAPKRKRGRKKKAYFNTLMTESSCEGDLSCEESGTTFTATSSLEKGFESSSVAETIIEDDLFEASNRALERIWETIMKKRRNTFLDSLDKRSYHLALPILFSLFALTLLLQNDSRVCLADIFYFLDCDSITYYDAFLHIPKFMKLQGIEDLQRFWRSRHHKRLEIEKVKVIMFQMFSLLNLGKGDFGGPFLELGSDHPNSIIERYIQEFSLPKVLSQTIRTAFKHTKLLQNLYCNDIQKNRNHNMIPDVSIRVCAVILVVLKYIYGLDDFTEHYISSSIRKANENRSSSECLFVIDEWIKLSRLRVFIMMRRSATFFKKFKELIPRTKMDHSTYITDIYNLEGSILKKEAVFSKKNSRIKLDKMACFLLRLYGENLPSRPLSFINETLIPMHKFSMDVLSGNDLDGDDIEPLMEDERNALRQLMDMHENRLGMRKALSENDNSIAIEIPVIESSIMNIISYAEDTLESTEFIKLINAHESYRFDNKYYLSSSVRRQSTKCRLESQIKMRIGTDVKTLFRSPDSYSWILQYFAAYIYSTPDLLASEVEYVEKEILKRSSSFFGEEVCAYKRYRPGKKDPTNFSQNISEVMDYVIASHLDTN